MTMFLTGNLDIFPQYRWNDPDTENYYETYYDVTDKNKKVSFEGLDINYHRYHSSSYQTRHKLSQVS
jgi:hypothetical protein